MCAWTLEAGDRYDAEPDPVGWAEMLLVSAGSTRVEQEDGHTERRAVDHLAFPTSRQYAHVNVGDTRARFVRTVVR